MTLLKNIPLKKDLHMKKINIFIAVVVMLFSAFSQAEQALSKDLITSFQQLSQQWETLDVEYPELSASLDDIELFQPEKIISQLKSSKAYPQIKSMLANSNFDSIEEYYNVAVRVMGGMMAHQMQNMPEGMNADSLSTMLKSSIAQMKSRNAPSSVLAEMEKQLADMEKSMKMMKSAMANTSTADKKFISDNAQWVMSILGDN